MIFQMGLGVTRQKSAAGFGKLSSFPYDADRMLSFVCSFGGFFSCLFFSLNLKMERW